MSRHVPGPWRYDGRNWRDEETETAWYVHGDPREDEAEDEDERPCLTETSVCIVPRNATSHPVCEDTARLISAAPDLLAACEGSLRLLQARLEFAEILDEEKVMIDRLRAATDKAKGV